MVHGRPLLDLKPLLLLQPQGFYLLLLSLLQLKLLQLQLLVLKRGLIRLKLLLLKSLFLHQLLLRLLQFEFLYAQLKLALLERILRVRGRHGAQESEQRRAREGSHGRMRKRHC